MITLFMLPKKIGYASLLTAVFLLLPMMNAAPLEVGDLAPKLSVADQDQVAVEIPNSEKDAYTLVYFYPKADTPGCTAEACGIRDAFEQLIEQYVTVIGVSSDDAAAQRAFKKKYKLPFSLIPDVDSKVINAFGVPMKNGHSARQSFLIKNGKIVWRDLKASTAKQAEDVLAAIHTLSQ